MALLRTVAIKVKHSPQIIRKTLYTSSPNFYRKVRQNCRKGKNQEDWLHAEDSLNEGIHFYVKMLGSSPVTKAHGPGCADEAVEKIVANTKKVKNTPASESLKKVLITVSTRKLIIQDMLTKEKIMDIPIYRVSYCVADPNFTKVFAFISRVQGKHDLNCYAFLCSKESMAQALALTIADAFKLAYENYEKAKSAKNSENSQVAKNDDKENSVEPKSLASNGNADIYATPTKAKASSDTPVIQITEDSSSDDMKTTERKMKALDLAVDDDDFDAEFTKLAESRSNPTLFETPVRRRDFFDDVNYLVATETTAKELMMSKSHEDLFSL